VVGTGVAVTVSGRAGGAGVEVGARGAPTLGLGIGFLVSGSVVGDAGTRPVAGNWPPAAALTPTLPQNKSRVTGRMAGIVRETSRPMVACLRTGAAGLPK